MNVDVRNELTLLLDQSFLHQHQVSLFGPILLTELHDCNLSFAATFSHVLTDEELEIL